MRIRSIKPEFWRSPDITELAVEDRLLFIGLWSYVDDNGVGLDRLAAVAADLFAGDLERDAPETFARVSRGLARLSAAGRIVRYRVDGVDYLEVVNWLKHQRIDKPGKERYPRSDTSSAIIRDSLPTSRDFPAPGTGEQGNRGTGEQGIDIPRLPAKPTYAGADFDATDEEFISGEAARLGVESLERVRSAFSGVGISGSDAELLDLVRAVVLLASEPVRSPEAYVETVCRDSPETVTGLWGRVRLPEVVA